MVDGDVARNVAVFLRLVRHDGDGVGALGGDLRRHVEHREAAVVGLAAGHRDGVVEQDLVGDVDAGRGGSADRQRARVVVGAVAQILEEVAAGGKGRFADPLRPFAAHLGEALGLPVHPQRHEVAADASSRPCPLGHHGGGRVRAASAEIGLSHGDGLRCAEPRRQRFHLGEGACDPLGAAVDQPAADLGGDVVGLQRAGRGEQRRARLVHLADDGRRVGGAVEDVLHLRLDQAALFLHHDDGLEPVREGAHILARQRPGAADLEEADAEVGAGHLVETQRIQRLEHVEPALAGADDAGPRPRAAANGRSG